MLDNLNTHVIASLYQAFGAQEALRIVNKLELVYTPKHGSWLDMAECEPSVLSRQCLGRRIDKIAVVESETSAWTTNRNASEAGIDWRFTTDDARIKLKRMYTKIQA